MTKMMTNDQEHFDSSGNAIIIFIKNPVKGKIKTRLAKEVGEEKALSIYHKLLDYTRETVKASKARRFLFYSDYIAYEDEWDSVFFSKNLQNGQDLGEKMKNAFAGVLSDFEKVTIIGSDCPQITADILDNAFKALDENDLVIGPAFDGGYYLLGMKNLHNFLFENITWSMDTVYEETISRARDNNLSVHNLKKLADVDYWDDWIKYGAHLR